MDEILKVSIQEVQIDMKKKGFSEMASANDNSDEPSSIYSGEGFSEVSSANDNQQNDSELEQLDEGFSDISSANDDESDSSDNT